MLVYGDPQYSISAQHFLNAFERRLISADPNDADSKRAFLIQAGQFEQALFDSLEAAAPQHSNDLLAAMHLTDVAARALFRSSGEDWLRLALKQVEHLRRLGKLPLRVKIPEGYEFYGLYPEQFMTTACRWLRHTSAKTILVVGVRSIGTSLSAVVQAALNDAGRRSKRITVRPLGHPFQRRVAIQHVATDEWDAVIIVDEGPGLSGSSVAAVCSALKTQGFSGSQFHIFPGHEHGPGECSSPEIRRWWTNTPRWFSAAENVTEGLLEYSGQLAPNGGGSRELQDASSGKWRAILGLADEAWPIAMIPFERPKWVFSSSQGLKMLWKFAGLGAMYESGRTGTEEALLKIKAVSNGGFGPEPLGTFKGFVSMSWIAGIPLKTCQATEPAVLERLFEYLSRFSGPALEPAEAIEARDRLCLMTETNIQEALGSEWVNIARKLIGELDEPEVLPTYSDGRMGPHEWLRTTGGAILKTDCFGHDADHTWIGKQPLLWDAAGLITEWQLGPDHVKAVADALNRSFGAVESATLDFYRVAYSAFRMGQCTVCYDIIADPREKTRLHHARERYCTEVSAVLTQSDSATYVVDSSKLYR